MRCRAVRDGLIGTSYIREGDVFEMETCPGWAVPVGAKAPAETPAGPKAPKGPKASKGVKAPADDFGLGEGDKDGEQ